MTTLTPWFDGKIHKPARPGVYQVRLPSSCVYRHWDGKTWGFWHSDADSAGGTKRRPHRDYHAQDDWRGICKPELSVTGFLERMAEHLRDEMPPMEILRDQPGLRASLWNSIGKQAEHIYLSRYEKGTK